MGILGCLEVSVMAWIYGADKFLEDLRFMLGFYPFPRLFWKWAWKIVSPSIVVLILFFTWTDFNGNSYGEYDFPAWANGLGWCITFSSIIGIPIVAIIKILQEEGSFINRVHRLLQPSEDWGPSASSSHHRIQTAEDGFKQNLQGSSGPYSSATLYTNISNPNIIKDYKDLASASELETLKESDEDDYDGLNMKAIRIGQGSKK